MSGVMVAKVDGAYLTKLQIAELLRHGGTFLLPAASGRWYPEQEAALRDAVIEAVQAWLASGYRATPWSELRVASDALRAAAGGGSQ